MELRAFARTLGPSPLLVTPHPDDESYAFGGLLRALSGEGLRPRVACATARAGTSRHGELLGALKPLGLPAEALLCGGLPDGQLETCAALDPWLAALFKDLRPTALFTLGPDGVYGHRDHLALWRATLRARAALGDSPQPPRLFWPSFAHHPDLFAPLIAWLRRRQPGLLGPPEPTPPHRLLSLNLDAETQAAKRAAIAAHASQLPRGEVDLFLGQGVVQRLCLAEVFAEALP